jgi:hypothetical protein
VPLTPLTSYDAPVTAADVPDPATLDAVERELRAAFGLPTPAMLVESTATPRSTGASDESAQLLAVIAPAFGVDPSSLRLPPRPTAPAETTPTASAVGASLTEAFASLREPAAPRRSGRAFGEGTLEQRLERLEIAIREVKR